MTVPKPTGPGATPGRKPAAASRSAKPWTARQVGTRIVAILLAGVLVVLLHFTGLLDGLQRKLFPPPVNWANDYAVVEHLRDQVVQDGLTRDAKECLLFIINGDDPQTAQRIRVMEKHNAKCPGTAGQLPKLFTLRVDRTKGVVETDQGSPDQFHAMPAS